MTKSNNRESQYPIDPIFLDRWSPRAFTGEIIEEAQLLSLLDAAHWAPSSSNQQPWRFIYALKGSEHWEKFVALLVDANQEWAKNASSLIFVVTDLRRVTRVHRRCRFRRGKAELHPFLRCRYGLGISGAPSAPFRFLCTWHGWHQA